MKQVIIPVTTCPNCDGTFASEPDMPIRCAHCGLSIESAPRVAEERRQKEEVAKTQANSKKSKGKRQSKCAL